MLLFLSLPTACSFFDSQFLGPHLRNIKHKFVFMGFFMSKKCIKLSDTLTIHFCQDWDFNSFFFFTEACEDVM